MAYELQDVSYGITIKPSEENKGKTLDQILKIVSSGDGKSKANNYTEGSTIIINSDRLILNSKKDFVFLCGKEGVAISSPNRIHIDCDDDLYLFSKTEVYLGLPARGEKYDFDDEKQNPTPKNKAQATKNVPYEPMVLGLKLANLLQDLIVLMKNAVMVGNSGQVFMSTQMMYNLACLQARVPEIMSSYAYIDGVSHDNVDDEPPQPADLVTGADGSATTPGSPTSPTAGGTAGSTTTSTSTGTTSGQNNPSGTPAPNPAAGTGGGGGTATPVAATGGASNPVVPSQNLDGPAPTDAAGWVPGQLIAQGQVGTEIVGVTFPGLTPQLFFQWRVEKAQQVDMYKASWDTYPSGDSNTFLSNYNEALVAALEGASAEADRADEDLGASLSGS